MPLKHYIPISVGVFLLVILTARHYSVPIAPFALVLLVGETIIGLQLEDQKSLSVPGRPGAILEVQSQASLVLGIAATLRTN